MTGSGTFTTTIRDSRCSSRCALLHYQFEDESIRFSTVTEGSDASSSHCSSETKVACPPRFCTSPATSSSARPSTYDRLQLVRERGEITEWVRFFLDGVAVQSADAIERAEQLADLREDYRARLAGSRSRAGEIVRPPVREPDPHRELRPQQAGDVPARGRQPDCDPSPRWRSFVRWARAQA